jgi:hypothetical protein
VSAIENEPTDTVLKGPALWQAKRLSARVAAAEMLAEKQTQQIAVLTAQRDEAIAASRASAGLQARLERQQEEVARALTAAKAAVAERDEARAAWDTLRIENARLRKEIETLKARPPQPRPALISDAALEEETVLAERRGALVSEQQVLQAEQTQLKELGQQLSQRALEIKASLADLQRALEADARRFKTLKVARNNEISRLEREVRRLRPWKPPADEAAKPVTN